MNVTGGDHHSVNHERALAAHGSQDGSQQTGMGGKVIGSPVAEGDGEEVGRSRNGHGDS